MILKNIRKSFGEKKVLEQVDIEILEKEVLVILGNSGSGKSTLLKIIAGIEAQDQGTITLDSREIQSMPMQKRKIGYLFQEPLLFPHMTVKQNVVYSLVMAKVPQGEIEEKFEQYMEYLQISDLAHRMPHEISGGQKQRVAMARSIINSPQILLMDEPFSSLDYNLRQSLGKMLLELRRKLDLTIVFVTHDIEESMFLGDRIAFLNEGRIVEINTPQSLYYNPKQEQTAKFMGEYNIIFGTYEDGTFNTKYGIINSENITSESEKIYVRPNKVSLEKNSLGKFIIESIRPHGTANRVQIKGEPLVIDMFLLNSLKDGDKVDIHFEY